MKTSISQRVLTIAFLSLFMGASAYAFDWGKNKRKKEKQEVKCCNKAMAKECAKEADKKECKASCEKKSK